MLLLFICLPSAWSQLNFFPQGAIWTYGFNIGGLVQAKGYTECAYTGDIALANKQAKRLARTTYYFDYYNPAIPIDTIVDNALYMAQSGDSILYYNFSDTSYKLLWKINVSAGDQFDVDNSWQLFTMTVDSVVSIQIQNQNVQKIWIDGESDFGLGGSGVIYDMFGPVNGFFYYNCWGKYDCYPPTLCRYYSDDTGEINFSNSICNLLTTAVSEPHENEIHLYPNPCHSSFTVELPENLEKNAEVEIYTTNGGLIQLYQINSREDRIIDVFNFPSGIYFCKIRFDTHFQVYKLIKL